MKNGVGGAGPRIRFVMMVLVTLVASLAAPSYSVLAHGNCRSFTTYNDWVGSETSSPNYSRTAVQAFVEFTPYSDSCIDSPPLDPASGPSAWIAMVPRSGGSFSTIIQVGIILCYDDSTSASHNTACNHQSSPYHYFYSYGGCNQTFPYAYDAGAAPTTRVSYVLWRESSPFGWIWRFNANGINVFNILESDSAVSCWLPNNRKAVWSSERWDRGDFQAWSAHTMAWDTMAFKATNSSSWQYPNWSSCNYATPYKADQTCQASGQTMQNWTVYDTGSG